MVLGITISRILRVKAHVVDVSVETFTLAALFKIPQFF